MSCIGTYTDNTNTWSFIQYEKVSTALIARNLNWLFTLYRQKENLLHMDLQAIVIFQTVCLVQQSNRHYVVGSWKLQS